MEVPGSSSSVPTLYPAYHAASLDPVREEDHQEDKDNDDPKPDLAHSASCRKTYSFRAQNGTTPSIAWLALFAVCYDHVMEGVKRTDTQMAEDFMYEIAEATNQELNAVIEMTRATFSKHRRKLYVDAKMTYQLHVTYENVKDDKYKSSNAAVQLERHYCDLGLIGHINHQERLFKMGKFLIMDERYVEAMKNDKAHRKANRAAGNEQIVDRRAHMLYQPDLGNMEDSDVEIEDSISNIYASDDAPKRSRTLGKSAILVSSQDTPDELIDDIMDFFMDKNERSRLRTAELAELVVKRDELLEKMAQYML